MHPSCSSCHRTHLTARQLQQRDVPKEGHELSLAAEKNEEGRWYKYSTRVKCHINHSLLFITWDSPEMGSPSSSSFLPEKNLKRREVHESTPYMRSYFGSDIL